MAHVGLSFYPFLDLITCCGSIAVGPDVPSERSVTDVTPSVCRRLCYLCVWLFLQRIVRRTDEASEGSSVIKTDPATKSYLISRPPCGMPLVLA